MIKRLIGLAIVALIAIIGYNYFLGDAQEKETSRKIVAGVKDVGKSVGNVVKSEAEKLSERKMDRILEDLGGLVDRIRDQAPGKSEVNEEADKLANMLRLLEEEVRIVKNEKGTEGKDRRALRKKIDQVESEVRRLAKEAGLMPEETH